MGCDPNQISSQTNAPAHFQLTRCMNLSPILSAYWPLGPRSLQPTLSWYNQAALPVIITFTYRPSKRPNARPPDIVPHISNSVTHTSLFLAAPPDQFNKKTLIVCSKLDIDQTTASSDKLLGPTLKQVSTLSLVVLNAKICLPNTRNGDIVLLSSASSNPYDAFCYMCSCNFSPHSTSVPATEITYAKYQNTPGSHIETAEHLQPAATCNLSNHALYNALHINARSIKHKMYYTGPFISFSNPQVVLITEAWHYSLEPDLPLMFPGYRIFYNGRAITCVGGCLIYVHDFNAASFEVLHIGNLEDSISIQTRGSHPDFDLLIGCIYNPLHSSKARVHKLSELLTYLSA